MHEVGASTYHRRRFWGRQNDGSVNVYYHFDTFSSYFSVNFDLTLSSSRIFVLSSISFFSSFFVSSSFILISLFYADFTVAQPSQSWDTSWRKGRVMFMTRRRARIQDAPSLRFLSSGSLFVPGYYLTFLLDRSSSPIFNDTIKNPQSMFSSIFT